MVSAPAGAVAQSEFVVARILAALAYLVLIGKN